MWLKFAEKTIKEARVSKLQVISDQFMNKIMNNPRFDISELKLLLDPRGFFGNDVSQEDKNMIMHEMNSAFYIDFADLKEMFPELEQLDDFMVQVVVYFNDEHERPDTTGLMTSAPSIGDWNEEKGDFDEKESRNISIKIQIPILPFKYRSHGSWRYFMQTLRSTVRHELEHLFQYARNPEKTENTYQSAPRGSEERRRAYSTDPSEHEAFAAGLRAIVKHPNRVVYILNKHMSNQAYELQLGTAKQVYERYPATRPFLEDYIQKLQKTVAQASLLRTILHDYPEQDLTDDQEQERSARIQQVLSNNR